MNGSVTDRVYKIVVIATVACTGLAVGMMAALPFDRAVAWYVALCAFSALSPFAARLSVLTFDRARRKRVVQPVRVGAGLCRYCGEPIREAGELEYLDETDVDGSVFRRTLDLWVHEDSDEMACVDSCGDPQHAYPWMRAELRAMRNGGKY